MKINFCLRADGRDKPGGDISQAHRLAQRLCELGHEVEITFGSVGGNGYDIAHLINIDLPLENLSLLEAGASGARRVVLSTVHHPFAGIREYYEHGGDRFFEVLRKVRIPFAHAPTLREGLKIARYQHRIPRRMALSARRAQQILASKVDLLLPLSAGERDALAADLGEGFPCFAVPNGMTFAAYAARPATDPPRWDVAVVGRIEPRKNTLAIARAVRALGLRGVFVGAVNANHREYGEAFRTLADNTPSVDYLGTVDNSEVARVVAASDVYVNAAWFEVVSLADVEAACIGTRIATTRYSYVADVIGDHHLLDPLEMLTNGPEALAAAVANARPCQPPELVTWQSAGDRLEQAYRHALDSPSDRR